MLLNISLQKKIILELIVSFVRIPLSSYPSVTSLCTCYQSLFSTDILTGVDMFTFWLLIRFFAEDFPLQVSLFLFLLFLVHSRETWAITANHLLVLCAVRVSNKLKSWNENQMSHVWRRSRLAVGRQCAPPPTSSGAQQVFRGLGQQPSIPWNHEV